jgi:hypothetical protein
VSEKRDGFSVFFFFHRLHAPFSCRRNTYLTVSSIFSMPTGSGLVFFSGSFTGEQK